ncbi:MAG: lytic transglycosylase domain-containing protein, partial [Acetobacteraceae bacterium]|nr:lytic transglycosylase domain-containing protein [Acetobacteraceae bacterium]
MRHRSARLVLVLALLTAPAAARADARFAAAAAVPASAEPGQLCRAAVAAVEREAGLPPRLLAAMARVETGRRDPDTGRFHPWPWTINAEGRGSFFPTKAAAIAAVQALQALGVRSIDVGCMQINLRHHANAFASLEEAFDPVANARYAARFLKDLQATRGDWMLSASHYHSQTPGLADAYRARIAAAMESEQAAPPPAESPPPPTTLAAAPAGAALPALPRSPAGTPATPSLLPPAFAGAGGGFLLSNRSEGAAVLPRPTPGA